ncbi:MAG: hypothetical protein RR933_06985 [Oscillospiraceae bacterium]
MTADIEDICRDCEQFCADFKAITTAKTPRVYEDLSDEEYDEAFTLLSSIYLEYPLFNHDDKRALSVMRGYAAQLENILRKSEVKKK